MSFPSCLESAWIWVNTLAEVFKSLAIRFSIVSIGRPGCSQTGTLASAALVLHWFSYSSNRLNSSFSASSSLKSALMLSSSGPPAPFSLNRHWSTLGNCSPPTKILKSLSINCYCDSTGSILGELSNSMILTGLMTDFYAFLYSFFIFWTFKI